MGIVETGGIGVSINAVDNTQKGIESAKESLKNLQDAASKTSPVDRILNGAISQSAGIGGLTALTGGLKNLFETTNKAGTALNQINGVFEKTSGSASNGAASLFKVVAGIASVSAILKGNLEAFKGIGAIQSSTKNFFTSIKEGYRNSAVSVRTQARELVDNSKAVMQNRERLLELINTNKKTKKEFKESDNLVKLMNETYKGLNLTFDRTTGRIGNVTDISKRIEAAHNLNRVEANRIVALNRVNQLNAIAAQFGIQNASALDRQRVKTLLLANSNTFLGITAKGASAAMLALKGSMASNPLGWILLAVEGVTLLGAGIYNLVKRLWDVPSAAQKAAESMERLNKTSAANFDSHQRMLDRLEQFNAQGGVKTVDDKKEAQAAIDTLNAYHGLGLTLDELGKVNLNSKALEQHRERLRDDRRFAIAGAIRANEDVLEETYKKLAKKKGRGGDYDAATGEQKIKIRLELDMLDTKEGEEIAKLKEKLENLYKERQKLLDESDAKAKAQREAFRKRSREVTDKGEDFIEAEQRELRRQSLTEEAREIEAVKTAYKKLRDPLRDVMLEKSKAGQNNIYELGLLQRIDELEQKRIAHIRNQYAEKARAAEKEKEEKEAEKDRALIEKLTEEKNAKNRTALENEIYQFRKSIEERKQRLQTLVEEGKATDEQKKTLEEILQLEKERTAQIKQQHLEQLQAKFKSFNDNQAAREQRQAEAAEDRKTRKDIDRNPFKAGLNLKAQREEIEAKIEEAKKKVEQAHTFALKQGDLTDKQKAIVEQREKNLLDLQQQQDRLQGLMGEAENEARNRVASLLQQYASEKTPSVLDTKFKGTVEAYKAEIENQQRGQMDGKDVKLENIKTILERDEQRKQQNEQKIIEIGRQIVANLQGV